jgi:hypothetical protein
MSDQLPQVTTPHSLVRLACPLFYLEQQLRSEGPVRIVAIGSSSTAGEGTIQPYPGRLESAMKAQHGGRVTVINRGIGGEEAPLELSRLDRDVIAEAPALTIWQIGTNAAYKQYDLDDMAAAIDRGLSRLCAEPMDVLLIDPQYVPALLKSETLVAETERMVSLIAFAAQKAGVNLFSRFALMRHWHTVDHVPVEDMAGKGDPLHQNEWSTARVAEALKLAIDDGLARAKLACTREPGLRA